MYSVGVSQDDLSQSDALVLNIEVLKAVYACKKPCKLATRNCQTCMILQLVCSLLARVGRVVVLRDVAVYDTRAWWQRHITFRYNIQFASGKWDNTVSVALDNNLCGLDMTGIVNQTDVRGWWVVESGIGVAFCWGDKMLIPSSGMWCEGIDVLFYITATTVIVQISCYLPKILRIFSR